VSPSACQTLHDELATLLGAELNEHREVFASTAQTLAQPLAEMLGVWEHGIRQGGKILLFGNGGSAADAQHIAAELVVRYQQDRSAIAAIALTGDSSTLTACGNDLGYESIFARQIEALGRTGDVAVGISTSGRSPNVIRALCDARARGMRTTGFAGCDGGEMRGLCDSIIVVPSRVTARIQEMHMMVGHILCKALEHRLGLL
jgi:D-sedoheptulose 7-phosphate isomerase